MRCCCMSESTQVVKVLRGSFDVRLRMTASRDRKRSRAGAGGFRRAHASLSGAAVARTGATGWWGGRWTTRPARRTTRWPSCWASAILAGHGSTRWRASAIRKAVPFAFSQIKTKMHLAGKVPRTKAARTAPIADLDPHFLFSFSGIKTAVLRYVELQDLRGEAQARAARFFAPGAGCEAAAEQGRSACALFATSAGSGGKLSAAVVGDLMKKTFAAAESMGARRILVTGGVAANRELRERFTAEAGRRGVRVAFPTLALSTDNAAMIAAAAWPRLCGGGVCGDGLVGRAVVGAGGDPAGAVTGRSSCDPGGADDLLFCGGGSRP